MFLVVILEQAHARQPAVRHPDQAAKPMQREGQRVPPQNPVPHVEANEREQLGGGRVELVDRAVVAGPIQPQMGGHDAPARHGRDVGHVRQDAGVAEKANQAEMIQRRPKTAARKCKTNLHRSRRCAPGELQSPAVARWQSVLNARSIHLSLIGEADDARRSCQKRKRAGSRRG